MALQIQVFFLILIWAFASNASELISVPSGRIEAIWLTPLSSKEAKNEAKKTSKSVKKLSRKITVSGFKVLKYPVTRNEFREFLSYNSSWTKDQAPPLYADAMYLSGFNPIQTDDGQLPMTHVSWFAARAFCRWKEMRLPTINEWEYMAAASEKTRDANRDPLFLKRILEWYSEPQGKESIKPVGSIYKNYYGIWDLHGLIWEWVDDFNSSFVTGESREDSSFNKDMFCGAGALSGADKENYAAFMRFAFRSSLKGRNSVWNLGFRCVK